MTQTLTDLEIAKRACLAGAKIAQSYFRNTEPENKASGTAYDPVTEGDKQAELAIRAELKTLCPDDGIFGEEFGESDSDNKRQWIIDPIDGTRAFVAGVPTWGTLVGLTEGRLYKVGAACQPITGDVFCSDGTVSWLNDRPVKTRYTTNLTQLRLATTDLALLNPPIRSDFQTLASRAAITRYGLDWYHYALLAAGGFDAVIECGLQPYDIAALVPIIRGAGGIVTDIAGGPDIGPTVLAAANPALHEKLLRHFN